MHQDFNLDILMTSPFLKSQSCYASIRILLLASSSPCSNNPAPPPPPPAKTISVAILSRSDPLKMPAVNSWVTSLLATATYVIIRPERLLSAAKAAAAEGIGAN